MEAVEVEFGGCTQGTDNLFDQFRTTMRWRAEMESRQQHFPTQPLDEMLRANGLVPTYFTLGARQRPFVVTDDLDSYSMVGHEWRAFYDWLVTALRSILEALETALSDGHILCCETTKHGQTLVPPSHVGGIKDNRSADNRSYLFTRDLPPEWFNDVATLPLRKKRATAWIERAGKALAEQGKRAPKADLLQIAGEKFELSPNALNDIWPKCDFPNKIRAGAIPTIQRVSLNVIREIE